MKKRKLQKTAKTVLSNREVELLLLLREREGWTYQQLATKFEIHKATVQGICTGRRRSKTFRQWLWADLV